MLEQANRWGKQDTVGGVNAEGGDDAPEDTEEEGPGSVIDTVEGHRGEEGSRWNVILEGIHAQEKELVKL